MALNSRYTRGIEIEIGGNVTKLKTALDEANRVISGTQKELNVLKNNLKIEWNPATFQRAQELAQRTLAETQGKADSLRKALAELDKQGEKKDTKAYEEIRRELSYTEVAAQKATAQLDELSRLKFDKLKNSISGVASNLNRAGNAMTVGLTVPLVAAGTAATKYASDTEEALNKVDVAFGTSAQRVRAWSENTLTQYGLARGTALDMAALFGDMATSMGYADDEAATMSTTLVGLAADLASFKNISIDQASTALKSIFTGETESLKNLGIVMTQVNLKAFALAQGYETAYEKMGQAQQVAVRYQYVLQQTQNAQGDFARTFDATANQSRIFSESLKEAAATAGQELLPVITPIIARLNELIVSFGDLDEGTRKSLVQFGLFLAALGPMAKLTGLGASAVSGLVGVLGALKTAQAAAAGGQLTLNAVMAAMPAGALATAIGLVVAALGAWAIADGLMSDKQASLNRQMRETIESCDEATQSIRDSAAERQGELDTIKELIPRIEELNSKTNRSAQEQEELNALVSTANGLYPGLIGNIDSESGAYDLNTQAIYRNIEALRLKMQIETNESILAEKLKAKRELQTQLEQAADIQLGLQGMEALSNRPTDRFERWALDVAKAKETTQAFGGEVAKVNREIDDLLKETADLRGKLLEGQPQQESGQAVPGETIPTTRGSSGGTTPEQQRVEAYRRALTELDFLRDIEEISEAQYYEALRNLRDKYLAEQSDEWRAATVKLHQYEAQQKKAEAQRKKEAYQEQLDDLQYFRKMELISEEEYYTRLGRLQSDYLEEGSAEWRNVNTQLFDWQKQQQEQAAKNLESVLQERKKKLDELTQQRIASIEAELAAEEKRLNATIEGINEEIAARRRLRQEESDEDAVARAQKKLDAAKAQLSFARDDYSRAELQKEVTRAQQSLDEAVQSKEDNDWYAAKQAEIDALERQIALAREAAQRDMDSAGQWAKKALAEQEAYQYYYQREQEAAQAAQRTAQVASTAAKVATATLGAISNVTNNNAVKIVTGAAAMTSGQVARLVEKSLEKLSKG